MCKSDCMKETGGVGGGGGERDGARARGASCA